MKIIKLTEDDGGIVYLNTNHIVFFERNISLEQTSIFFIKAEEHSFFEVIETPEEIIELIKQSEII